MLGKGDRLSPEKKQKMIEAGKLYRIDGLTVLLYKIFTETVESNGMSPTINSDEFKEYMDEEEITSKKIRRQLKQLLKQAVLLYQKATNDRAK